MKIVALVSGGKDSCYNMMQCVANGHEITAIANLKPPMQLGKDELDSFMYQTVGHDAIHFYAECMDVPLYRQDILGSSIIQSSDYRVTEKDETEDLYILLKTVLEHHPDIKGVSVGAILSNYQRVRVEHVCNRLGLMSFAYLWRRDQKELLYEMANAGVNAVLIKIAAIGLKTIHLGKSIGQMYPYLCKMNDMYDLHICGEGGEYETFTLDCPLFKKRIIIEESETIIHSDDAFAQVAYLRFKKCRLEDKTPEDQHAVLQDWREFHAYESITEAIDSNTTVIKVPTTSFNKEKDNKIRESLKIQGPFLALGGITASPSKTFKDIEEETEECMNAVQEKLLSNGFKYDDVVSMNVLVSNMDDFARVNAVYKKFFDINPSPRALVGANLTKANLQIDLIAIKESKRDTMHVQGISYWAPANIGPYSQSVISLGHAFIAGQIGLIPNTLELPPTFADQAALSLRNLENIVNVLELSLMNESALWVCYVSDPTYLPLAEIAWNVYTEQEEVRPPILFVSVPALPKNAMVEWQVLLHAAKPSTSLAYEDDDDDDDDEPLATKLSVAKINQGPIDIKTEADIKTKCYLNDHFITIVSQIRDDSTSKLIKSVTKALEESEKRWKDVLSMRVFYNISNLTENECRNMIIKELNDELPAITCIPATAIGTTGEDIIACTVHAI
ncbi:hypothetical protein K501DRAFT_325209 [Backusella circina FSU 941]|nr:hypothetical protein K501DRAFT_325209 [Backusella circina FSU 941]